MLDRSHITASVKYKLHVAAFGSPFLFMAKGPFVAERRPLTPPYFLCVLAPLREKGFFLCGLSATAPALLYLLHPCSRVISVAIFGDKRAKKKRIDLFSQTDRDLTFTDHVFL